MAGKEGTSWREEVLAWCRQDLKKDKSYLRKAISWTLGSIVGVLISHSAVYLFGWIEDKNTENYQIRQKIIDKKASLAEDIIRSGYDLKKHIRKINLSLQQEDKTRRNVVCSRLKDELGLSDKVDDYIDNIANSKFFFGQIIRNEAASLVKWVDTNGTNCFSSFTEPDAEFSKLLYSLQDSLWAEVYPDDLLPHAKKNPVGRIKH